jgi:hypothetical protein
MDTLCQRRLAAMGLCHLDEQGRCTISAAGERRHATEVLRTTPERSAPRAG